LLLRYGIFGGNLGNILRHEMDQHYRRHSINKLCADSIFISKQDSDSVIQGVGNRKTVVCGRKYVSGCENSFRQNGTMNENHRLIAPCCRLGGASDAPPNNQCVD
jgi:hypothetical protein